MLMPLRAASTEGLFPDRHGCTAEFKEDNAHIHQAKFQTLFYFIH